MWNIVKVETIRKITKPHYCRKFSIAQIAGTPARGVAVRVVLKLEVEQAIMPVGSFFSVRLLNGEAFYGYKSNYSEPFKWLNKERFFWI